MSRQREYPGEVRQSAARLRQGPGGAKPPVTVTQRTYRVTDAAGNVT
jgi:hypothetical protein